MKVLAFVHTQKFYSLFSSVFNAGIALVSFALLARILSKDDFGQWAFFLAIYGFFEMAFNGMVRTPLIRMAAHQDEYQYNHVLSSAWDLLIKVSSIGILLSVFGVGIYSFFSGDSTYSHLAYWLPLYMLVSLPKMISVWNANAIMKFQRILVIRTVSVFLFLIGVVHIYFYGGGVGLVFWYFLLAMLITSILVLFLGWSNFRAFWTAPKSYRKEMIDFGKYSMGTTIGASGLSSADSFIIISMLGPRALALYEVPRRIMGLFDIPLRAILQLSYPYLSKMLGKSNPSEFRQHFERLGGFTFLLLTPLAILIFVFSDFFVTVLGGAEYADSAILLRVFSLYLLLTPLSRMSGVILDVLNRPNINFTKLLLMLSTNVVGDILVIQLGYGVVGVAWVTVIMAFLGLCYGYYMHRKEAPFNFFSLLINGSKQGKIFLHEYLGYLKRKS